MQPIQNNDEIRLLRPIQAQIIEMASELLSGSIEFAQTQSLADLRDHEGGIFYGHAIQSHVGKSDSFLARKIRDSVWGASWFGSSDTRAGTFPSLDAANKLVRAVLAENVQLLQDVIDGKIIEPIRLNQLFSSPTGREAYALRPWDISAPIFFRDTFGAAVIVVYNRKARDGYSIITAFPFFD